MMMAMPADPEVWAALHRMDKGTSHFFRAAKTLWTVRKAIPWPIRWVLTVAAVLKCMPTDFFIDESLTGLCMLALMITRPGLVTVVWHASAERW